MKALFTDESGTLTREDVRLLRALQVVPRASFATIADALGVTDTAVRRRYRRLHSDGIVRVAGIVDPGALGHSEWLVRLRCRPGSVTALADALARRADVSWVAITAAGSEITCAVRPRGGQQRDDLLGEQLPRTAAVLDIEAAAMLRRFLGGRGHYWAALAGALSADEQRSLGGELAEPFVEAPAVARRPILLTPADEAILGALAADGRAAVVELAAAGGLSVGQARRRLHTLIASRVVHIDVEISAEALGLRARANLWLRVHPSAIKEIGRALAKEPEIAFVAAVSGRHNLHAVAACRDVDDLFELTTDRIGSLPGLQSMEVSPLLRHVKQAGTLVSRGRLQPPR